MGPSREAQWQRVREPERGGKALNEVKYEETTTIQPRQIRTFARSEQHLQKEHHEVNKTTLMALLCAKRMV